MKQEHELPWWCCDERGDDGGAVLPRWFLYRRVVGYGVGTCFGVCRCWWSVSNVGGNVQGQGVVLAR